MADRSIDVDTRGLLLWRDILRDLGENAIPLATRKTLNDVAFDMKGTKGRTGGIERRSHSEFDYRRNKTFIKSLTGMEKAKGYDVNKMVAGAGIQGKSGKNQAAEGLAKQETGKDIKHKYAPLPKARISKSELKKVGRRNFHDNKGDYTDTTRMDQYSKMRAIYKARKSGGVVLVRTKRGRNVIGKPHGSKKGRNIKMKWIYQQNKGGVANLKGKRPFVSRAAEDAIKKTEKFFKKNTQYLLNNNRR